MYSAEFRLEASDGENVPALLQKIIETRRDVGIIGCLEEGNATIARIKAPTIYAIQLLIEELKKEQQSGTIVSMEAGKIHDA